MMKKKGSSLIVVIDEPSLVFVEVTNLGRTQEPYVCNRVSSMEF
jgi:hypothetical protein